VYAAEPDPELEAMAGAGLVALVRRDWREADLDGALVAVAEEEDPEEAARFAAAARARGALVNVIDNPPFCDFQFGAIVNRSPVVIGISTDGAAPILAQDIRRRVEAILPSGLGAWSRVAKGFRERLKELGPGGGGSGSASSR
jgi:uroporphyrin-III C-methyltransferase/precorrin-2 dehydrogenase/sirohydrochlorin ferrochelatase